MNIYALDSYEVPNNDDGYIAQSSIDVVISAGSLIAIMVMNLQDIWNMTLLHHLLMNLRYSRILLLMRINL